MSHPILRNFSKASVRPTQPSLYAVVLKQNDTPKVSRPTVSPSLEELNRQQGIPFFGSNSATPAPWDDSKGNISSY